jgi:hypothetical protein
LKEDGLAKRFGKIGLFGKPSKRRNMDPLYIKLALGGLALLACIGLFFGIGLALAAHKFAVEVNPKVEAVKEVLAGAQ